MTRIQQQLVGFALSLIASGVVLANPVGGVVVPGSGSASISHSGSTETIHQNSSKVIINWQSFNIANGETTSFIQPAGGIALNRVTGSIDPSSIFGTLTSTGKIILINQAGIYFGPNARVNVGGIIASTSDIKNENFIAGRYKFDQPGRGSVINKGHITAADYGLVALIGTNISNDGVINARLGNVVLASGDKFTVDLTGDQLINFTVDAATQNAATDENGKKMKTAVSNKGKIFADGGTIRMTASVAQGVVDNVINMSGVAQARSVQHKNGVIILSAGSGNVNVSGKLDVSARNSKAGKIKVLGQSVHVESSAVLDARGSQGGGEVLVGGNYQGKGPEYNAEYTIVDKGALIDVSSIHYGSGGKAIVWSDKETYMSGTILAKGGMLGGNGGFVEVSGHNLNMDGIVNTLAPKGKAGTLLLDPNSIAINTADFLYPHCTTTGGTTTCDNQGAEGPRNLNRFDLQNYLNAGNVIITATTDGVSTNDGDVIVQVPIDLSLWSTTNSLTMNADHNVIFEQNVQGNGSLIVNAANQIQFAGASTIATAGGQTYTAPSIAASSPVTLALTGSGNMKFAGSITPSSNITVQGNSSILNSATTNQIDLSSYPGNVNINLMTSNGGTLRQGTETAPGSTLFTFNNIAGAIGSTSGNISLTVTKANPTYTVPDPSNPTIGSVGDPFYFTNIVVPSLPQVTTDEVTPGSVKYTPENNYETTNSLLTSSGEINLLVTESLSDLLDQQYELDKKESRTLTACY